MAEGLVVIGNGIAALSSVESYLSVMGSCKITMITEESFYTYDRKKLSELLGTDFIPEEIFIRPENWYRDNNVEVLLGRKVVSVDTDGKTVTLENGGKIDYKQLIIANGSHSFLPPVEGNNKKGVFTIRNIEDVKIFNDYTKDKTEGIIIGGGLLGLEAAWALIQKGVKVTVIEYAPRILGKQLDEEGSFILEKIVSEKGLHFIGGAEVAKILGNNNVEGVLLKDGRNIKGQFVIFSTGVRPNLDITTITNIKTNRGIIVDDYMKTNVDNVYAAGDIAEYHGNVPGIWPVALAQGKVAGQNAAGKTVKYEEIPPSNFLTVMGIRIFSIGDIGRTDARYEIVEKKVEPGNIYQKIFFIGGVPVGAILMGDIKLAQKVKKAIEEKKEMKETLVQTGDFDKIVDNL